jgi:hypothetical protein
MDPNTAVTITLNGSTALTNFAYGDSTEYFGIDADTYLVEVFPGASATPAITASLTLENGKDYTAIAIGDGVNQPLSLKALVDDNTPPAAGKAHLRLGHLAPFAADPNTVADVRLDDGTVILDDVSFGDVAGYIPLDAGTYDLKITTPDGATTLINLVPVTLNDGDIVSAFAVGDGSNQDLQGFALPSGAIGFFIPVEPRLQVAHLAPFAMDPNTVVTITLNGTPALTDFAYGDSTPYIDLDPDTYLVEVFPGSSATPAITATVDLMSGMDYTAIAIGDGVNQPLSLKALVDDNTPPAAGKAHLRLGHLAPFAADPDTVADVRLDDGTVILDDVSFSDVAGYIPLDAGTYDLKITTPDGAITLIDLVPVTLNDGDIVSAFAVGDGSNQDLQGFALPSGAQGFFIPTEEYQIFMPIIFGGQVP